MFDWLRRKMSSTQGQGAHHGTGSAVLDSAVKATALAQAIITAACDYVENAAHGVRTIPAAGRRETNVRDVWEDTRMEAVFPFFKHGAADIVSLGTLPEQPKLLAAIVEDQVQLNPMSASGEQIHDTVQALYQGFEHMRAIGIQVGAKYESEFRYVRDFEIRCRDALPKWREFEIAIKSAEKLPLPDMPPLLINIFWNEITIKAKNVAIARMYGSDVSQVRELVIAEIRQRMEGDGKSKVDIEKQLAEIQSVMDALIKATKPDDLLPSRPS